jgi:hypothetical protein
MRSATSQVFFGRNNDDEVDNVAARKWALVIVGLLFLLSGIVMALQGANVLTDSPLMSGNQTYIYVGGATALIGVILLIAGMRSKSEKIPSSSPLVGDNPKGQRPAANSK